MSEWQPIETAPTDGSYVLVFVSQDERRNNTSSIRCCQWDAEYSTVWNDETDESSYVGAWTDHAVRSFGYEETFSYQPTHWMPLPEPPK